MGTPIAVGDSPNAAERTNVVAGAPPLEPPDIALAPGELLGRYEILEEAGRGGMGRVYRARDPQLGREVALKVVKRSGGGSSATDAQARIVREARAMAQLSHPNVLPVYDVQASPRGVFLAMEYVRGKTLRAWLGERSADWRTVLRAYADAGRGLAAAHHLGLAHRDFKPTNVLVGDDGRVRVMDFGLARAIDSSNADGGVRPRSDDVLGDESVTATGTVVGTPAYMAPEQYRGEPPDPRTDQYSFCVALYEGLYGRRPFHASTLADLAAAKRAGVTTIPVGPVPPWVVAALRRGLDPDPARRFGSMDALLEALREDRHASSRRRSFGAVAVLLVAGGTWAVVAGRRSADMCGGAEDRLTGIWDRARRGQVDAAFRRTGLSHAASSWTRVESGLDRYAADWMSTYRQACLDTHSRGTADEADLDLRMRCLARRADELEALVDVFALADATVVRDAVRAVGSLQPVERCSDLQALRADVPPPEDPQTAAEAGALRDRLGRVRALRAAGKYIEAIGRAHEVDAAAVALDYAPVVAEAASELGTLLDATAEYERARDALERAYFAAAEVRHAEVASSAAIELVMVTGDRLHDPGAAHRWASDAESWLDALSDPRPAKARLHGNLGATLQVEGKRQEALDEHRAALAIREEVFGPEHPAVAASLVSIGHVLYQMGEPKQAREVFERALAIDESQLGPDHPALAQTLSSLAGALLAAGEHEQARVRLERAIEILEKALGPDHPRVADVHNNLGTVLQFAGRFDEAKAHYVRSLEIAEQRFGPDHPDVIGSLGNVAGIAYEVHDYDLAATHLRRALTLMERGGMDGSAAYGSFQSNLGFVLQERGDLERALGHFRVSLTTYLAVLDKPDHPSLMSPNHGIGIVLAAQGHPAEALPYLERALEVGSKGYGEAHPEVAKVRMDLARVAWSLDQRERARSLGRAAAAHFEAAGEPYADDLEAARAWLSRAQPR